MSKELGWSLTPSVWCAELGKTLRRLFAQIPQFESCFINSELSQIDFVDGDEVFQLRSTGGTSVAFDHVRVVNDQRIFFEMFPNGFAMGGLEPQ